MVNLSLKFIHNYSMVERERGTGIRETGRERGRRGEERIRIGEQMVGVGVNRSTVCTVRTCD